MRDYNEIDVLIYRYLRGTISCDEREKLEAWLQEGDHREWFDGICDKKNILQQSRYLGNLDRNREEAWRSLKKKTGVRRRMMIQRWAIVASFLIPILLGSIMYLLINHDQEHTGKTTFQQVLPGTSVAHLFLPDGQMIELGKDTNQLLELEQGGQIVDDEGTLTYQTDSVFHKEVQYSELRVPRGGEYKIVLPDGTMVWLNAESVLRFPTTFTDAERKVYAKGELYFDVKPDKNRPFVVELGKDYSVEVLGTEFNIRTYDETLCATTLVEGSVKVKKSNDTAILKPNEQAVIHLGKDGITVKNVDVTPCIAWKAGDFYFIETPLKRIMEELSRWYDIQIVFRNKAAEDECFSVDTKRFNDFNKILNLLNKIGVVQCRIEGRTVFVE